MNHRLPTRLVAYRRVGQDPTDPNATDPSTMDPNATDITGTDPNAGSDSTVTDPNLNGSGSSAVSAITDWLGGLFKGSASSATPAANTPTATNNAAVPAGVVPATSTVSPWLIAAGVGGVALTGVVVYAAAKGGRRRR